MAKEPLPDVIHALAEWSPQTLLSIQGLAQLFHRSDESVRRAIDDGELPRPVDIFGKRYWTVEALLIFIQKRLAEEAQEHDKDRKRVYQLGQRS